MKSLQQHWLHGCIMLTLFLPGLAHASNTGMPWESPLSRVVDSITGPIAFGASVLGIVAAGLTLIFGGQLDGFIRTLMQLALVISLIVLATNILTTLFNVSSTVVM